MTRGDVVEVEWPFRDLSGTKRRPAVVVQADFLNALIDDTIYVKVQGNRYGIPGRSRGHAGFRPGKPACPRLSPLKRATPARA
jgi:mRNA-degrading endonuclease toxin of MazEF toxin-antitoxin module